MDDNDRSCYWSAKLMLISLLMHDVMVLTDHVVKGQLHFPLQMVWNFSGSKFKMHQFSSFSKMFLILILEGLILVRVSYCFLHRF